MIARELHTQRQNWLTADQIARIYQAEYHTSNGYGSSFAPADSDWESDQLIKDEHARALLRVLPQVRKVIVGGCSSGTAIFAFRKLGIEAWGFEPSPDLDRIAIPEARPYIRSGSMTAIPFDRSDGFECLVTTDVLEHVQLRNIASMCSEVERLGTARMVHLINHTAIQPDHMTLRPLWWWNRRLSSIGYSLRTDLKAPVVNNNRIYGLNGDKDHAFTFWEKK